LYVGNKDIQTKNAFDTRPNSVQSLDETNRVPKEKIVPLRIAKKKIVLGYSRLRVKRKWMVFCMDVEVSIYPSIVQRKNVIHVSPLSIGLDSVDPVIIAVKGTITIIINVRNVHHGQNVNN
jgi:hypothetical protein